MASSRGRSTVAERRDRKSFVFGSSTPRDLSHMNKVPLTLRTYDSKPTKLPPQKEEESLKHYMRQARSLTPNVSGSRDGSYDLMHKSFVFGSSTPRQFSHLSAIQPELRVYDAKISTKVDTRSHTTPLISSLRSRTVPASRAPRNLPPKPHKAKRRTDDEAYEVASEPDFIQDRASGHDLVNAIKKQLRAEGSAKKKEQHSKGKEDTEPVKGGTKTVVREERRVIRTTTTDGDGKKQEVVQKVDKVERSITGDEQGGGGMEESFVQHSTTVEDEATDLPVQTTQACIVPHSMHTSDLSGQVAKSVPTVEPLNDSSEVVVVCEEMTLDVNAAELLDDTSKDITHEVVPQQLSELIEKRLDSSLVDAAQDDEHERAEQYHMQASFTEPSKSQHRSIDDQGKLGELNSEKNLATGGDLSELTIGYSPQAVTPEQETKLVLDTEPETPSDPLHPPLKQIHDTKLSSERTETEHDTHGSIRSANGMHSADGDHHLADGARSVKELSHSIHEMSTDLKSHSSEGTGSISVSNNSAGISHALGDAMDMGDDSSNGTQSLVDSVHLPQESSVLEHSLSGKLVEANTPDDVSLSLLESVSPSARQTHEHSDLQSEVDAYSLQPREGSPSGSDHWSGGESQKVSSDLAQHIDVHSSDSLTKSFHEGLGKSPEKESYFEEISRYETRQSPGYFDEHEEETYRMRGDSKSSSDANWNLDRGTMAGEGGEKEIKQHSGYAPMI